MLTLKIWYTICQPHDKYITSDAQWSILVFYTSNKRETQNVTQSHMLLSKIMLEMVKIVKASWDWVSKRLIITPKLLPSIVMQKYVVKSKI